MIVSDTSCAANGRLRRKAVWGPKRSLAIFSFIISFLLFGLGNAGAAGSKGNAPWGQQKAKRGAPKAQKQEGNRGQNHSLDDELTSRVANGRVGETVNVIV